MAEHKEIYDKAMNEMVGQILRSGRAFSIKVDRIGDVMTMSIDVQKLIGDQGG